MPRKYNCRGLGVISARYDPSPRKKGGTGCAPFCIYVLRSVSDWFRLFILCGDHACRSCGWQVPSSIWMRHISSVALSYVGTSMSLYWFTSTTGKSLCSALRSAGLRCPLALWSNAGSRFGGVASRRHVPDRRHIQREVAGHSTCHWQPRQRVQRTKPLFV